MLPFVSLTESLLDRSFAAGLTEELIHQIIQIPYLQIHQELKGSRHEAQPKGRRDVPKWNVRGSVRSICGISRVIVQLVDAASNTYIWSETYDREIGDTLAIQEEIAKAVVAKLKLTLDLPELKTATAATAHGKESVAL